MYLLLKSPEVEDEEEGSHLNGARERGRGRRVPAAGPGPPFSAVLGPSASLRRLYYFSIGHLSECDREYESVIALLCIRVLSIPRDRRYPKSRTCTRENPHTTRDRSRARRERSLFL